MTRSPIASSRGMFQTASSRGSRRATFADGSLIYIYIYIYKRRRYSSIVLGQFYGGWDDLQLIFKAELLKRYCKANSL
jgi:hypothetical protein